MPEHVSPFTIPELSRRDRPTEVISQFAIDVHRLLQFAMPTHEDGVSGYSDSAKIAGSTIQWQLADPNGVIHFPKATGGNRSASMVVKNSGDQEIARVAYAQNGYLFGAVTQEPGIEDDTPGNLLTLTEATVDLYAHGPDFDLVTASYSSLHGGWKFTREGDVWNDDTTTNDHPPSDEELSDLRRSATILGKLAAFLDGRANV